MYRKYMVYLMYYPLLLCFFPIPLRNLISANSGKRTELRRGSLLLFRRKILILKEVSGY